MMTRATFFACFILSGLATILYGADTSLLGQLPEGLYKAKVSEMYCQGDVGPSVERMVVIRVVYDDEKMAFDTKLLSPDGSWDNGYFSSDDEDFVLPEHVLEINEVKEFFQEKNYPHVGFQICKDGSYVPFTDKLAENVKWAYQFKFADGQLSSCRIQEFKKKKLLFRIELKDIVRCDCDAKTDWDF